MCGAWVSPQLYKLGSATCSCNPSTQTEEQNFKVFSIIDGIWGQSEIHETCLKKKKVAKQQNLMCITYLSRKITKIQLP